MEFGGGNSGLVCAKVGQIALQDHIKYHRAALLQQFAELVDMTGTLH